MIFSGSVRSPSRRTRSSSRTTPVSPLRRSPKTVLRAPSAALESAALSYLAAHYIDGVAAIFASQPPSHFTVQIVSNKYNPTNFWFVIARRLAFRRLILHRSGRWRSQYHIDFSESRTIQGKILVNVHYYEQGNVGITPIAPMPRAHPRIGPAGNIARPLDTDTTSNCQCISERGGKQDIRTDRGRRDTVANLTERIIPRNERKGIQGPQACASTDQAEDRLGQSMSAAFLVVILSNIFKVTGYKLGAELTASKGAFVPSS